MKTSTTENKDKWKEIDSIEKAFKWKGLDPALVPDVSMLPEEYRNYIISAFQLAIVVEAINDGWEADYTDHKQPKYYLYAEVEASEDMGSGFGFSHTYCDHWCTDACAGSRLAFETREKVYHAYKKFPELFKNYLLK